MATNIIPERFSSGDFLSWFRHFERCAQANSWNEETRLCKLPAFLQGPAASYFESLDAGDRTTYQDLVDGLKNCFAPAVNREQYYREFEEHCLRPTEDPTLYLWRLKDALHLAEPDLSEDAFDALLRRQFFKGLPNVVQLKLLESHPTPGLDEMLAFSKRFRSLQVLPSGNPACATTTHAVPPQFPCDEPQCKSRDDLQMLLTQVVEGQNQLIAAIGESRSSSRPEIRCFECHEVGHMRRHCPRRRRSGKGNRQCSLCSGWGHNESICANNKGRFTQEGNGPRPSPFPDNQQFVNSARPHYINGSKASLNFQGCLVKGLGRRAPLCFCCWFCFELSFETLSPSPTPAIL